MKGLKIGIMGCIVNGPGEMADADFGYVGAGPGVVNLYVGHEVQERGIPEAELMFEDMALPPANLLMPPRGLRKGFADLMTAYNSQRVGAATVALGIAQGAYEKALQYAKEREQFGRPIGENQGVQFQLADAATELEASRLLVYNAARLRDTGEDFLVPAAMAKLHSSRMAQKVTSLCIDLFGGYGFTREFPVEKFYRDSKIGTIYEGTTNMQLQTIARGLLG